MLVWRKIWSFFDYTLLRLFEKDDAALLRAIAEELPSTSRDVTTPSA